MSSGWLGSSSTNSETSPMKSPTLKVRMSSQSRRDRLSLNHLHASRSRKLLQSRNLLARSEQRFAMTSIAAKVSLNQSMGDS